MKYQAGDRVTVNVGESRRPGRIEVVGRRTDDVHARVGGIYTDTTGGVFFLQEDEDPVAPIDFHADGSKPVRNEQPKPSELGCVRIGDRVVVRGKVESVSGDISLATVALEGTDTIWRLESRLLHHDTAAFPPQAESKLSAMLTEHGSAHGYTEDPVLTLERLIAGYAKLATKSGECPRCADNAGMLDAACKRLGEREVEHAAALRELTRITAEFRAYRKEHR